MSEPRRRPLRYQRASWAIVTGDSGFAGAFVGAYRMDYEAQLAPWQRGVPLALFTSRSAARAHLPRVKGPSCLGMYPHARVVRVDVKVLER